MFADPVTIAASGTNPALTLAMRKTDGYGSERFDRTSGAYVVVFNHTPPGKNGDRHYMNVKWTKDVTLPSGIVQPLSASASVSIAAPPYGFSAADKASLIQMAFDILVDSEVTVLRFVGGES
jgi:hypothetical protein